MSFDTITSPIVGRADELAALRRAVGRAAGRDPRIVLVEGDAGIGKSRLIAELLGELDEQGVMTLVGTCPPISGAEMPLAPLAQALRHLRRKLPADDLGAALGPSRAALAHLVPALGDTDIAPSPSEPSPSLILEHVLGVLERLSERNGPIVLVFEDLHWASPSVWDLLAFLARNLRDVRLAIIASYRRDGLVPGGRTDQLLTELQRSAMVDAVTLAPLGRADMTELVALLGVTTAVTNAGVDAIIERSEGNPFFVEELVAGGAVDGAAVPESLRTMLLARIAAQPESTQELLRIAAVIGRRVPTEILIHASGAADHVVVPLLRGAVSAGILEHIRGEASESYAFRQGLMREVIYADLVPGERSRLHGTVARVLMARPESSPTNLEHIIEVASHWRQSGDLMRGVPALLKAAQAAEGAYAFSEAHALFEQAFALGARLQPAPIQRQPIGFSMESRAQETEWPDLLARAAEAASLAGEPRSAVERIEAALAQAPEQRLERWRWAARRARYLLEAGRRADGLAAYEEAAAQAADASAAERARILVEHARALVSSGQYAHGQEVAELAVTTARSGGQRAVEWQALNALGTALSLQGEMAPALEVLTAAHQLSAERSSPSMIRPRPSRVGELMGGYFDAARTLDQAGLRQDAVAAALEGAQAADRYGSAAWRDRMGLSAAAQLYGLGRWEEAGALVDTARAHESGGAAAEALVIGSRLAIARGDWEQAQADLEAAEPLLDGDLPGEVVAGFYLATADRAYWRRQLRDGAQAIVSGLAASYLERDRLPKAELCLAGVRLEAELHEEARLRRAPVELAHHSETAARYAAEIQAILGDVDDSQLGPSAIVLTAQAELGRLTASSADAWGAAALAWERAMEPYREAYAGWRLAEAHLLSGRGREEATRRLRDAWTVAQRLGARPLADEIAALARRARIELTSPEPGSAAVAQEPATQLGLSSRELEVLAVLARGLTNRQIAAELFITEKTAANHVSNILAKLGVSNRLEAAGIAYRVGLVLPGDNAPMSNSGYASDSTPP